MLIEEKQSNKEEAITNWRTETGNVSRGEEEQ